MHEMILRAGRLEVDYRAGFLRYLRLGNTEVVRMIYFALRDAHWNTLPLRVVSESVRPLERGFRIAVLAESMQNNSAVLRWEAVIEGHAGERIVFDLTGTYLKAFDRNRAGFCLLHPLRETVGMPFRVRHSDRRVSNGVFPVNIAPHQPCRDIVGFSWRTPNGIQAQVVYEGEVFEMEDQRNWTDASFKTYCTPLDRPFPVREKKGHQFRQRIELRVSAEDGVASGRPASAAADVEIALDVQRTTPRPRLGSCLPLDFTRYSPKDRSWPPGLPFDSIRVDLRGGSPDQWYNELEAIFDPSRQLQLPVHLFLQQFAAFTERTARDLRDHCPPGRVQAVTVDLTMENALFPLRTHFPGIRIGIGTPYYFTQLNRQPPPAGPADHICFSNNPQVHAFDRASLVETFEGQAATVSSVRAMYPDQEVWVSPVSLRARFNPDAGLSAVPGGYAHPPDVRIGELFTAGWTIGCLSALAQAGAAHIDWYELYGPRGLVESGVIRPVWLIFNWLTALPNSRVFYTRSSAPLQVSALGMAGDAYFYLILANHTDGSVSFTLPEGEQWRVVWVLDQENWQQQVTAGCLSEIRNTHMPLQLPPQACMALFRTKNEEP